MFDINNAESILLKPGIYIAEKDENIWDSYRITLQVKETDKSYILQLVEFEARYGEAYIEALFQKSTRVVLRKNRGGHPICKWSEEDFTIYPYQAGIPYYFKRKGSKP